MFRTIISLLICLLVAVVIGAFQILGLTVAQIQALLGSGSITSGLLAWGALLFAQLIFPYSAALSGVYGPLVALGVAGFVAGLISKSGVRMFFVSIISIVLFFLGFALLSMGLTISDYSAMWGIIQSIAIDLGASFALIFIPGVIGASLTAEEY
ncbi:MAG: hypothetical protein C4K47_08245 [Candidatus Thorarchaeota archaeon]|nr:MAG: hypothetical protein C4K47_08245 [Candidatus Thorarchaeota archaeon]